MTQVDGFGECIHPDGGVHFGPKDWTSRSSIPKVSPNLPRAYRFPPRTYDMAYQTTLGWSLLSSGIVTLVLIVLPGDSLWWGIGLILLGFVVLYVRRDDAFST